MRFCLAAPICALGTYALLNVAHGAELTNIASSFDKEKPVGFKIGASYSYTYKTASITRESLPYFQSPAASGDVLAHYRLGQGQTLTRTETIPDLVYTQRRQMLSVRADIGVVQAIQI